MWSLTEMYKKQESSAEYYLQYFRKGFPRHHIYFEEKSCKAQNAVILKASKPSINPSLNELVFRVHGAIGKKAICGTSSPALI